MPAQNPMREIVTAMFCLVRTRPPESSLDDLQVRDVYTAGHEVQVVSLERVLGITKVLQFHTFSLVGRTNQRRIVQSALLPPCACDSAQQDLHLCGYHIYSTPSCGCTH